MIPWLIVTITWLGVFGGGLVVGLSIGARRGRTQALSRFLESDRILANTLRYKDDVEIDDRGQLSAYARMVCYRCTKYAEVKMSLTPEAIKALQRFGFVSFNEHYYCETCMDAIQDYSEEILR